MNINSVSSRTGDTNGKTITLTISGHTCIVTGSNAQEVFKYTGSGTSKGAWTAFSSLVVGDWLLTNLFNSSFNDYFWQVSAISQSAGATNWYSVTHPAGTATDQQDIYVTNPASDVCIAIRTY